jgi:NAD(P)-dependent dehydrogenase (short-subunit alcohol dehydrogenase family)
MRVLVTGASHGGIGGAVCRRLARNAARRGEVIALTISTTDRGSGSDLLAAELRELGSAVLSVPGDLSSPDFPGELADRAIEFCDGLDVVVSNAGMSRPMPLAESTLADWDEMIAVHARAPWLLAKATFATLSEARGCFIATGSISGTSPHADLGAYPVAKAALIMMCQTLALEWAHAGVRVNVVSPGPISRPISAKTYSDPAEVRPDALHRASRIPAGTGRSARRRRRRGGVPGRRRRGVHYRREPDCRRRPHAVGS